MKIIELGNAPSFGGKAGNLNKIYSTFDVARGFVLKDEWFQEFLRINRISTTEPLKTIKQKIENGIFPDEDKLLDYFKKNEYDKVIVRSSASVEDGDNFSFAGLFESFPDTDKRTLISNIKKCWLSRFQTQVETYLESINISKNFSYDCLIQEMKYTPVSGLAFSIDPSTGEDTFLIEAVSDTCNNLILGKTTPHTYRKISDCDDILDCRKYQTVQKTLKKLKKIFKKEIEIEFGFQNDTLFIFQVRPITKTVFSLKDHIESVNWCCFKNNDWTLFNRSLWIMGAVDYKHPRIENEVTEDITIYFPDASGQIRGFNGGEPPLSEETIEAIHLTDIDTFLDEYNLIVEKIYRISKELSDYIEDDSFEAFRKSLRKLIENNCLLETLEYLIGSLGQALHDKLDAKTIKKIETWRNDESNSYFPIYSDVFAYLGRQFKMSILPEDLRMYSHVKEIINLCENRLSSRTLSARILKRKRSGFVLFNLHNKRYHNKVLTDSDVLETVKNRFATLQEGKKKTIEEGTLKGRATFKSDKTITGKCLVIKGPLEKYKDELRSKIIVCKVTTAKDVKYLKSIKALVVDNGGILCHSAIISRELGIPCIMGCDIATEYLHTGDHVLIDLNDEIIKKL
ncbi:MAG TPA: hypothetical protein DCY94_02370 [Firmicutes bacterium]|nr:hypothetical protein [Bacillota bacterium]